MKLRNKTLLLLAGTALGMAPLSSMAASSFQPSVSGELVLEWQNEYRSSSDDATIDDTNNSFLRAELAHQLNLTENVFVDGVFVFEPFDQAASKNANDDIWFESNGLFAEELKLNFARNNYSVFAGKFNPGFGSAWDYGRGIWGEDFAEDYEITEKLGVGASYAFETKATGTHTVSASTFFADTSFLSGSTITHRDKAKKADGGASNTEDFSSFALSLDGENLGNIEGLNYHLGLRHLAQGDADTGAGFDDEDGLAANINYTFALAGDLELDTLVEIADIQNFEGVKGKDHTYLTTSVVATYRENWNLALSYTSREINESGTASDFDDTLFQASAGYDFQNGLTAEAGYRTAEEANQDTDIVGFLMRYSREF